MADAESSGLPVMIYVPSVWMGVCSYDGGKEDFPFKMEINSLKGKDITGTINWPTLNNAKTKMKGKIEGNTFNFTEYEAIVGEKDVQIPSYYSGKISEKGKIIKGKTVQEGGDGDEDDATFQLDLVEEEESEEEVLIPKIKEGSKLPGKCYSECPFTLKVTKRKGDMVEGTISWKIQQCKTKFKGTVTSKGISFEEYEITKKSDDDNVVTVPMIYSGGLDEKSDVIKGDSGPARNKLHNKFEINLFDEPK